MSNVPDFVSRSIGPKLVLIGAAAAILAAGLLGFASRSEPAAAASKRASPALAAAASGTSFTADQKKEIGDIVKEYLVQHPEILSDAQNALEAKLEKDQAEKLKSFMADNGRDIYRSADASMAGDPKGDITVVEFFDYNCGYCKRGMPEVQKLIQADPRVRIVFKELPILSKGSEETAKVALAARRQGKYWEFHQAMLATKGQANEAASMKMAEGLGLDMEKLKADYKSDAVKDELEKSKALAKKMGINGTPHFLVGDKSIPGAPEDLHEQLHTLVGDFRKAGCSFC